MHHAGLVAFDAAPVDVVRLRGMLGPGAGTPQVFSLSPHVHVVAEQATSLNVSYVPRTMERAGSFVLIDGWIDRLGSDDPSSASTRRYTVDDLERYLAQRDVEDCGALLEDVLGDWTIVRWHGATETLQLASDFLGVRPTYYASSAAAFVWSSSLEGLVSFLGCEDDLDERYLLGYLTRGAPAGTTPYRPIRVPPAGALLTIGGRMRERLRTSSFVRLEERTVTGPRDHAALMRARLEQAVIDRVRRHPMTWGELSGGLDSSTLTCLAYNYLRESGRGPESLATITYTSRSSPEWNEEVFVKEVVDQCDGLVNHALGLDEERFAKSFSWVSPDGYYPAIRRAHALVRRSGGKFILSGRGGDAAMGNRPDNRNALADPLVSGRLFEYVRGLIQWSERLREPFWWSIRESLLPLLPVNMYARLLDRQTVSRYATSNGSRAKTWSAAYSLQPHLEERAQRLQAPIVPPRSVPYGSRPVASLLLRYSVMRKLQQRPYDNDIVYTYPYLDLRVIRCVLSTPARLMAEPGATRVLMRRAFADVVPPRIMRRISKGYGAPPTFRLLRDDMMGAIGTVDSFELVQRGIIDPSSLRERLERAVVGTLPKVGNLKLILALESWLRLRADRRSARTLSRTRDTATVSIAT